MRDRRQPLTFFDLPREMRDLVYGHVLDDIAEAVAKDERVGKHTRGYWSRPLEIENAVKHDTWPPCPAEFYVRQHLAPCPHLGLFDIHPLVTTELCDELQEKRLRTTLRLSLRRQTGRPRQLMGKWTGLDLPLYAKHTISTISFQIPPVATARTSEMVSILRPFLDDTAPCLFADLPNLHTINISFPSCWYPPGYKPRDYPSCVEIRSLDYSHCAIGTLSPTFRVTKERLDQWLALNVPISCPATYVVALVNYMEGDFVRMIPFNT